MQANVSALLIPAPAQSVGFVGLSWQPAVLLSGCWLGVSGCCNCSDWRSRGMVGYATFWALPGAYAAHCGVVIRCVELDGCSVANRSHILPLRRHVSAIRASRGSS